MKNLSYYINYILLLPYKLCKHFNITMIVSVILDEFKVGFVFYFRVFMGLYFSPVLSQI